MWVFHHHGFVLHHIMSWIGDQNQVFCFDRYKELATLWTFSTVGVFCWLNWNLAWKGTSKSTVRWSHLRNYEYNWTWIKIANQNQLCIKLLPMMNSIILKSPNQLSNGLHCFSFSHPTRSIRRIVGLSSEIISIIFIIHIITNNLIITIIIISNSSKLTNNCLRHTRILVITQILARAKLSTARLVFGNLGWKLLSVLKIDLVPRPGSTFGWKLVLENHFAPRALNPRTFLSTTQHSSAASEIKTKAFWRLCCC